MGYGDRIIINYQFKNWRCYQWRNVRKP